LGCTGKQGSDFWGKNWSWDLRFSMQANPMPIFWGLFVDNIGSRLGHHYVNWSLDQPCFKKTILLVLQHSTISFPSFPLKPSNNILCIRSFTFQPIIYLGSL